MQKFKIRAHTALLFGLVGVLLFACATMKRILIVGGSAAAGTGAGLAVGGPVGGVAGGGIAAGTAYAAVEADASSKRADDYAHNGGPAYVPRQPKPPPSFLGVAWWWWVCAALYLLFRNRAHVRDLLLQKGGRWNAVMRASGLRTHRTPIKQKDAA